jgi:shikimate dehydrogenase
MHTPPISFATDGLLLGLIGAGIELSRTPALHMAEAQAQGMRCVYRRIDLSQLGLDSAALPELLLAAERMGFQGLNITHPCKQAVIPLLHRLSDEAAALGAVNTVVLRDGERVGHNTDCSGFGASFREGLAGVALARAVQLGAGGAGAAVAHAVLDAGVRELTLFDIDPTRAAALAAALSTRFGAGRAVAGTDLKAAMAKADGLVHATPTGTAAHPGLPLDVALLAPRHWVAEIVYFPLETPLLAAARAKNCRVLDGGGMAVHQAADAFRLFTGRAPDVSRMRATFAAFGD